MIVEKPNLTFKTQIFRNEQEVENDLIQKLIKNGYELVSPLTHGNENFLENNLKTCLEELNDISFSEKQWKGLWEHISKPYLTIEDRLKFFKSHYVLMTKKVIDKNIKFYDEKANKNKFQILQQFVPNKKDRYDLLLLLNGFPVIHIENKQPTVYFSKILNQLNGTDGYKTRKTGLLEYCFIHIAYRGEAFRYFSPTINNEKFMNKWTDDKNNEVRDLSFFLEKQRMIALFDCMVTKDKDFGKELVIMRPYQIAAMERTCIHIENYFNGKEKRNGGYIWHATGSGKTLTSFMIADRIKKKEICNLIIFVVDRKDLNNQTEREFKKLDKNFSIKTANTDDLERKIDRGEDKIIVTTIQKMVNLCKRKDKIDKKVLFIFDECHRSHNKFGESQKHLKETFKYYFQLGITGTPIAKGDSTTAHVFPIEIHTYNIKNAIDDKNVLPFHYQQKVVLVDGEEFENEDFYTNEKRIALNAKGIIASYHNCCQTDKQKRSNGMLCVDSIEMAREYSKSLEEENEKQGKHYKIVTLYSPEKYVVDDVMRKNVNNYNEMFGTSFDIETQESFYLFKADVEKRVVRCEIDLLVVVDMLLTGFDAPHLNTLFVDKKLSEHGLIQAFSRTNRLCVNNELKQANIITYRDLNEEIDEAFRIYGMDLQNIIIHYSYEDYMKGYGDKRGHKAGYEALLNKLRGDLNDEDFVKTYRYFKTVLNRITIFEEYEFLTKYYENQLEREQTLKDYVHLINRFEIVKVEPVSKIELADFNRREIEFNESKEKAPSFKHDFNFAYLTLETKIEKIFDSRWFEELIRRYRKKYTPENFDQLKKEMAYDLTQEGYHEYVVNKFIEQYARNILEGNEIDNYNLFINFIKFEEKRLFNDLIQRWNLDAEKFWNTKNKERDFNEGNNLRECMNDKRDAIKNRQKIIEEIYDILIKCAIPR